MCSFFPDNEVTLNDSCSSIICFSITFFFFVVHCMQEESRSDVSNHILKILVVHGADEDPVDVSILVEGHEILPGCNSTAKACSLLMGLIYALNLAYPPTLRYTFEVFQKLLLELDGFKLSPKVNTLKLKLLS